MRVLGQKKLRGGGRQTPACLGFNNPVEKSGNINKVTAWVGILINKVTAF